MFKKFTANKSNNDKSIKFYLYLNDVVLISIYYVKMFNKF